MSSILPGFPTKPSEETSEENVEEVEIISEETDERLLWFKRGYKQGELEGFKAGYVVGYEEASAPLEPEAE